MHDGELNNNQPPDNADKSGFVAWVKIFFFCLLVQISKAILFVAYPEHGRYVIHDADVAALLMAASLESLIGLIVFGFAWHFRASRRAVLLCFGSAAAIVSYLLVSALRGVVSSRLGPLVISSDPTALGVVFSVYNSLTFMFFIACIWAVFSKK